MKDIETPQRPKRPTAEFLKKVGIAYLPGNVDVTFDEGVGRGRGYGAENTEPSMYLIDSYDEKGEKYLSTAVHAHEYKGRTKHHIWKDLQQTLVSQFNALPVADNDAAPVTNRLYDLFEKAGITRPLPNRVDARMELRGDMPYLVVQLHDTNEEKIVELRRAAREGEKGLVNIIRQTFSSLQIPHGAPVLAR